MILEGSFSAVSTPIFATKYAFFRIFRDLQDSKTFVTLQTKYLILQSQKMKIDG